MLSLSPWFRLKANRELLRLKECGFQRPTSIMAYLFYTYLRRSRINWEEQPKGRIEEKPRQKKLNKNQIEKLLDCNLRNGGKSEKTFFRRFGTLSAYFSNFIIFYLRTFEDRELKTWHKDAA